MFYIEGSERGIGYVFIDHYCYSVDYNTKQKYWLAIRGEPNMSACYYGSTEALQRVIKETLAGKEIEVPTREPDKKEDREKRNKVINEVLNKNRN